MRGEHMHKERLKEIATLLLNFNDPMSDKDMEIMMEVAYEMEDECEVHFNKRMIADATKIIGEANEV